MTYPADVETGIAGTPRLFDTNAYGYIIFKQYLNGAFFREWMSREAEVVSAIYTSERNTTIRLTFFCDPKQWGMAWTGLGLFQPLPLQAL